MQLHFSTPTKRRSPVLDRQQRRHRLATAVESLAANFDTSTLDAPAEALLKQAAVMAVQRNISLETATNILLTLALKQSPVPLPRKPIELPKL